jgi:hypothetical protein
MNMELINSLLDKWVSFHPIFAKIGGSAHAGIFLSQAFFWSKRTSDTSGWFYKTQKEWEEETTLTRYEQEHARKQLREAGVLQEKLEGVPAKLYYRIHWGELVSKMTVVAKLSSVSMRENHILGCGKPTNKIAGFPQTPICTYDTTYLPELKNSGKEEGELFPSPKPVEKPKRGRPAKPADPRHQEAIKMFCDMYEERFGTKYAFPVSDAKQLSEFLKRCSTVTVSEMRETLSDIWEYEVNKGEFVANRYRIHTLAALVLRWNDIKAILHTL